MKKNNSNIGIRKQPKALSRPYKDYITEKILRDETQWSEKEMRRAYSDLRDVAQMRLKRLKEAKLTDSSLYRSSFKELKDISDRKELEEELADVAKFVHSNLTKASVMKKWANKNIKELEKTQGRKMTISEFLKFDKFLKEWHKRKNLASVDSDRVVDVLENVVKMLFETPAGNKKSSKKIESEIELIFSDFDAWQDAEISTRDEYNEMLKRSKQNAKNKMK